MFAPAADGPRDGGSLLRVLSDGSQTDHARRRRHVRCGPRQPATAVVQRPLRRIRISADCRVRRRGPFHHRGASSRKRPSGKEIKPFLRRLLRAIRAHWPHTEILLRGDSHYCSPEVLDWCRANGLDYILGVATTTTLRRHVADLEASTKARFEAASRDGKLRRFKEFFDGANSWSRVERIIAASKSARKGPTPASSSPISRIATRAGFTKTSIAGAAGPKTTSNLEDPSGGGSHLLHQGDRQSVPPLPPRRRLLVDVGTSRLDAETLDVACRSVRHAAPAPHQDRRRVVEMKTMIRVHLPTSCPAQDILRFALERIRASSPDRRGVSKRSRNANMLPPAQVRWLFRRPMGR